MTKPHDTPPVPVSKPPPLAGLVRVYLGERKAALEAFCAAEGVSMSQVARTLLLKALDEAGVPLDVSDQEAGRAGRSVRKRYELLLSEAEGQELAYKAERAGFSFRAYMTALIRVHLDREPQFGQAELEALGESNRQLMGVMRALRDLAASGKVDAHELGPLVDETKRHMDTVRDLMTKNLERW